MIFKIPYLYNNHFVFNIIVTCDILWFFTWRFFNYINIVNIINIAMLIILTQHHWSVPWQSQLFQTDEAFTVDGHKHTNTHTHTQTHKHQNSGACAIAHIKWRGQLACHKQSERNALTCFNEKVQINNVKMGNLLFPSTFLPAPILAIVTNTNLTNLWWQPLTVYIKLASYLHAVRQITQNDVSPSFTYWYAEARIEWVKNAKLIRRSTYQIIFF